MAEKRELDVLIGISTLSEIRDALTILSTRTDYEPRLKVQQQRRQDPPQTSHIIGFIMAWFFSQDADTQDEILIEGKKVFDEHWYAEGRFPFSPSVQVGIIRPAGGSNEGPASDAGPKKGRRNRKADRHNPE
jgi:hypothetical protein